MLFELGVIPANTIFSRQLAILHSDDVVQSPDYVCPVKKTCERVDDDDDDDDGREEARRVSASSGFSIAPGPPPAGAA